MLANKNTNALHPFSDEKGQECYDWIIRHSKKICVDCNGSVTMLLKSIATVKNNRKGEKMEYKYIMLRSTKEENSFGIALVVVHRKELYTIEKYEDLTTNQSEMEALVHDCNELGLEPIHLKDIVENFIA